MIAKRASARRRGPPGLIIAGASGEFGAGYDGSVPFPGSARPLPSVGGRFRAAVTAAIVLVPFAGLAVAVWLAWGHGLGLADALLALGFYVVTGLGISVGFHRLFTHRSFTAARPLRLALAVAGSMSFEGDVIGWVAIHRRHHAFTDRPGDPHSPYRYGTSVAGQLRGLAHAHAGWLLRDDPSPPARYAPDMLADPAMRTISRGFPVLSAVSLALPLAAGLVIGGTWHAALTALLWAGLVRVAVLQHVTWSVNSLCHVFGTRPFTTRRHDRATNLWPLALVSFGESWHNMHHSDPACARHGADRGQVDISAGLIRIFEHLGWATGVRWPVPGRLAAHRRGSRQDQPQPVLRTAETAASTARDDLIDQRETARAYTASSLGNGTPRGSHQPATSGSRWNRPHLPASQQAAVMHSQSRNGQSASQTPAGASAPADDSLEGVSQP
jgi:stearoyl-CoA desaturase (Delta-9 desaturase)